LVQYLKKLFYEITCSIKCKRNHIYHRFEVTTFYVYNNYVIVIIDFYKIETIHFEVTSLCPMGTCQTCYRFYCPISVTALQLSVLTAVPWFRRLVVYLSPRCVCFAHASMYVGFVMDKVALGQVFLRVLGFSLSILFHRRSPYPYIIWGKNTTSISGSSSET
jgi:hypothetical protein